MHVHNQDERGRLHLIQVGAQERLNDPRLGKPGLRENASALAIEERLNSPRLDRLGLKDNESAFAIEERLSGSSL